MVRLGGGHYVTSSCMGGCMRMEAALVTGVAMIWTSGQHYELYLEGNLDFHKIIKWKVCLFYQAWILCKNPNQCYFCLRPKAKT